MKFQIKEDMKGERKSRFLPELYKGGIIFVKSFSESVSFALSQLWHDKFRTFLSLCGMSIGIFSIVAIFSAIDALREVVYSGFESLGNDAVMVQQMPAGPETEEGEADLSGNTEYRWWEYLKRPKVTADDYRFLKNNMKTAGSVAFASSFSAPVKLGRNAVNECSVFGVTEDWERSVRQEMERGRYFSPEELSRGSNAAVLGKEVAEELFGPEDPVGKKIRISGRECIVIGVCRGFGEADIFQFSISVQIPWEWSRRLADSREAGSILLVRPAEGADKGTFKGELRSLMRTGRRLAPGEPDNFSLVELSFWLDLIDQVYKGLNMAGWAIAGFSLLIGGFGIANIMFVSVRERTHIIGIQKALGAKKYVILIQFLTESVCLAVAGGLVGIALVALLLVLLPDFGPISVHLSLKNIAAGVGISSAIGILSGCIPARTGARLNPVEAINTR